MAGFHFVTLLFPPNQIVPGPGTFWFTAARPGSACPIRRCRRAPRSVAREREKGGAEHAVAEVDAEPIDP